MSNPLHAAFYADQASSLTVPIVENVRIAQDTFRLRFACPEIAAAICPGQFLMLRLAECNDPLIGRPLALYEVIDGADGTPEFVDVVYLVKGKFTSRLCECLPGCKLDVWGPLGNGFEPQPADRLIMVAGGIGQTPFLALAQEYLGQRTFGDPRRTPAGASRVVLCYGARTAALLAGLDDFERVGIELQIATDDGSQGHHGLVTELLQAELGQGTDNTRIVCCGPEPMMEAVSRIAIEAEVPCRISLETPMACGIGICFTCVAKIRDSNGDWDFKRTCVEGPVFEAAQIDWS